jgi:hypothetical protein
MAADFKPVAQSELTLNRFCRPGISASDVGQLSCLPVPGTFQSPDSAANGQLWSAKLENSAITFSSSSSDFSEHFEDKGQSLIFRQPLSRIHAVEKFLNHG